MSNFPSEMCWTRLIDPRLQTAISSWDVFNVISVQRLEECTTPVCCCGDRRLQVSLKVIQGWPVSKSMESIFLQRSAALTVLNSFYLPVLVISSYAKNFFSNAFPKYSPIISAPPITGVKIYLRIGQSIYWKIAKPTKVAILVIISPKVKVPYKFSNIV